MKLGSFGGHKSDGTAKRGMAKLVSGLPFLLLALAAWAVAIAGKNHAPIVIFVSERYDQPRPTQLHVGSYKSKAWGELI